MPKIVDYASRFQFVREAAFGLVLREGVDSLTRRSLAAELGLGVNTIRRLVDGEVELVVLAAQEVAARRRHGRFGRPPEDLAEAALALVRRVLPDEQHRIDEELVWLRLVADCALRPSGLEQPGTVRESFQIAEVGYASSDLDPSEDDWTPPTPAVGPAGTVDPAVRPGPSARGAGPPARRAGGRGGDGARPGAGARRGRGPRRGPGPPGPGRRPDLGRLLRPDDSGGRGGRHGPAPRGPAPTPG